MNAVPDANTLIPALRGSVQCPVTATSDPRLAVLPARAKMSEASMEYDWTRGSSSLFKMIQGNTTAQEKSDYELYKREQAASLKTYHKLPFS